MARMQMRNHAIRALANHRGGAHGRCKSGERAKQRRAVARDVDLWFYPDEKLVSKQPRR